MDGSHFDDLHRAMTASRRSLVGRALAIASGWIGVGDAIARKKRKARPKLKRNTFGCVDVGRPCRGNSANCCSGSCQGRKPKQGEKDTSTCIAHDAGSCTAGAAPCSALHVPCTTSSGKDGFCATTTGNAAYCTTGSNGECFPCTMDADCRLVCGASAACVQCLGCIGGATCAATDVCDFSP